MKIIPLICFVWTLSHLSFCQVNNFIQTNGAKYDKKKQRPIRISMGAYGGPSHILAKSRYSNQYPELLDSSTLSASFWSFFISAQIKKNQFAFSYTALPTFVQYSILNLQEKFIYTGNTLEYTCLYSATYRRDITRPILGWLTRTKRWQLLAGGHIGIGVIVNGGGFSNIVIPKGPNLKVLEAKIKEFVEHNSYIVFGPTLHLIYSVNKWFKIFGDVRLQITPYSPRSYELSYKVYPRPTPISERFRDFKTTRVSSHITNLSFSFGILFEFGVYN